VEAASESGYLGSLDMVEVNPSLGSFEENEHTVEMGLALISSAMGSRIL
jgi:arginase family enzyme